MLFWVTLVLLLCYAILMGYYVYHWFRVPSFVHKGPPPSGFVSVVVAARNEAHNLPVLLRALERQTLPAVQFEVIVVDDYSTDETVGKVAPFLSHRVQLTKPLVAAALSSKKRAIEAGVAMARGPLVVVTDADCMPQPQWLELMLACYTRWDAAFIVAPVQLTGKATPLGLLQQLDFMMLQGITAASVQAGAHSMCNGANLAYERSAFREVDGFAGVDQLASGDDMLLLYKIWRRHPQRITYIKHPGAIMPTPALDSWRAFIQQRIRWSSKATYYQDKRVTAVLFFVYTVNLWCLSLIVTALVHPPFWRQALLWLAVKTIIELCLLLPVARFYQQQRLLWSFPLLQPLHILYTVAIGLLSRKRAYEWKGRRTH